MTSREELKPCPFCGGEAKCNGHPKGIMGQIFCSNDDCFGPKTTALTREESVKQWNTRASAQEAQEVGLTDYFNPPRLKIAAFLLARDEADTRPIPKGLIDWATQYIKTGKDAEHSGDCTKESHSCHRCGTDRAFADADAMIALALPPQGRGEPVATDAHRWPRKGDWMAFLGKNGYETQLAAAKAVFVIGREYLVEDCDVGDWSHSIKFEGIAGRFNGVMFESIEPPRSQEATAEWTRGALAQTLLDEDYEGCESKELADIILKHFTVRAKRDAP